MSAIHKEWMRTPEVMKKFGVTRRTLYRLVESGRLNAKDVGDGTRHCYLFHPSYIEDFRTATELRIPEE